jgi:hypothetical protein
VTLRFDEMSQHSKQLDKRRKLDKNEKKKSHGSECPVNVEWHSPVVVFQSLILLSLLPLAIVDPLELHATEVTLRLR